MEMKNQNITENQIYFIFSFWRRSQKSIETKEIPKSKYEK